MPQMFHKLYKPCPALGTLFLDLSPETKKKLKNKVQLLKELITILLPPQKRKKKDTQQSLEEIKP